MKTGIYLIVNCVNGKIYVGSSARSFDRRKITHLHDLRKNQHHSPRLQNAWNKYGESSFEFHIIETVEPARCIEREQHWIDKLKPDYNICKKAGSVLGHKHTEETRQLMREVNQLPENKERRSKSHLGKKPSEATRQKQRDAKKGRKLSKEHAANISAGNKGKKKGPMSEAQKQFYRDLFKGRKLSPETRAKMSESQKKRRGAA